MIPQAAQPIQPPSRAHAIRDFLAYRQDPLAYLANMAAAYGDAVRLRVLNNEFFLFSHPRYVEALLVHNAQHVKKDRMLRSRSSRRLFGDGMLVTHGEPWQEHRQLALPAFRNSWMDRYAEIVVDTTERTLGRWPIRGTWDVYRAANELVLEIAGRAFFGADLTPHLAALRETMAVITEQFSASGSWTQVLRRILPTPAARRYGRALRHLEQVVAFMIEQRRQSAVASDADLMGLLLLAHREDPGRITAQDLRDEAVTFLIAGHETTALSVTWSLHLLARHPDIQREVIAELDRVFGAERPSWEGFSRLRLLCAVVKESLRLRPPAWVIARAALDAFDLAGWPVERGEQLLVSPWVLHHDHRFHANPTRFWPDRWLQDEQPAKYSFIPFGAGPRTCIGQGFATMETTLILSSVLSRYFVSDRSARAVSALVGMSLRPSSPILLDLQPHWFH